MMIEDLLYFADQYQQITPRIIPSYFGNIYSLTAGTPGQPLILVVHGSGPKNSADSYAYLLHQYLVKVSYLAKFYIVAIDCPGYGRSEGSKQAVKTFPLKLFKQILVTLNYKTYFAMLGHSQGGAAIFNAVHEDPTITQFLVMDRPVCGNIQRFRGFSLPTLLIYDIQDDGHPIWQGKLLYKELKNTELYTYRNSAHEFWVPDNIWEKMLDFFAKQQSKERKFHLNIEGERRNKSYSKPKSHSKTKATKKNLSVDKIEIIKKKQFQEIKLLEIEEIERSELMSISSQYLSSEHSYPQQKPELKRQEQQLSSYEYEQKIQNVKKQQKVETKIEQGPKDISPDKNGSSHKQLSKEQLQEQNRCAICYQTLYRPINTNCNHIFCNKCILQSLLVNDRCPLCRAKITKKTENKELHQKVITGFTEKEITKRENDFKKIQTMLKSIVYIEIGNTSRQLQTKKSIFTKTKKKYVWELFVKQPKNFPLQEVGFNINMGETNSKPVKIKNAPYTFESRGTFSFACQITIKPRNKEYADLISVYRIDVEPGFHSKTIALKKKCYQK